MNGRERAREQEKAGGVTTSRRWAEYLIAVLSGNIVYLYLEPHLPPSMRHQTFRVDIGLAVDFVLCVAMYGLVRLLGEVRSNGS